MTTPTTQLLDWAETRGPAVLDLVRSALSVAQRAHHGQFRKSGDPYIEHSVAVALVLAENGAEPSTVLAGILHDVLHEHKSEAVVVEGLRDEFGEEIVDLVVEFTALDHNSVVPSHRTVDPRTLKIKVADRVHNMRTIGYIDPVKQRLKAAHTRETIAPLARQLGLPRLGTELDDLATATLSAPPPAPPHPDRTTPPGTEVPSVDVRILRGVLSVGGLLLPAHSRHRWLREWSGELHAVAGVRTRLRFVIDVLLGLPHMAVTTRERRPR